MGLCETIVRLMISGQRRAKKNAGKIQRENRFFYIYKERMCMCVYMCVYIGIYTYVYILYPDPEARTRKPEPRSPKPDCLFHCVRKCCHCARLWVAAPDQESVSADVAG